MQTRGYKALYSTAPKEVKNYYAADAFTPAPHSMNSYSAINKRIEQSVIDHDGLSMEGEWDWYEDDYGDIYSKEEYSIL